MVIIPVRSKEPKFDSAAAHHDLHFRWSSLFLDDDGYGKDLALPNPHGKETSMFFYLREALQKSRVPPGGGILRFGLRCVPTSMQRKALKHNQTHPRTEIR